MNAIGRSTFCLTLLSAGVAAQAGLESWSRIDRPPLRAPLASLPVDLGGWSGRDEAVRQDILDQSQATEYVSRVYTNPKFPGASLSLWVNFSLYGTNMRHSPEICLPSHGYAKVEAMSRVLAIPGPGGPGRDVSVSRLAYSKGELVQEVGFWYYIFGESGVERWVRGLPVTSRSSHGRTTRGSGLTVEVFWTSGGSTDLAAFEDFSRALIDGLDPIMPTDRAGYFVP